MNAGDIPYLEFVFLHVVGLYQLASGSEMNTLGSHLCSIEHPHYQILHNNLEQKRLSLIAVVQRTHSHLQPPRTIDDACQHCQIKITENKNKWEKMQKTNFHKPDELGK